MAIDPKVLEKLRKTGLSEKEARVYGALLDLGGGYPSRIADVAQVNRSTTYAILTDLSIKGLVTEIERRSKIYYQLEKPEKLLRYARQGIRVATNRLEAARDILPDLEGLIADSPHKPRVRFFEGADGIMQVYEDHISGNEQYEMTGFSNVGALTGWIPKTFLHHYVQQKEQIGITSRGIFPDSENDINYNETVYKHVDERYWPELRFIPKEQFPYKSEITIYGNNRVSVVNFEDNGLIGVIIEDTTIHNMMQMIFNLAWIGAATQ